MLTMKNLTVQLAAVWMLTAASTQTSSAQAWSTLGNTGTNPPSSFLGTKDRKALALKTNNVERMRISPTGNVGIGIANPVAKLNVLSSQAASLTSPGFLMLGNVAQYNMALDYNVIQARYNGQAFPLYLNYYGGFTFLGPSGAVQISTDGTLTTSGRVAINGASNSSYALNVNPNGLSAGINVTDGRNAYALNATKSGSLAGIYVQKTSTSSYDACVWGNSTGSATGVQGNSATGVGVYGITNNSANYAGFFVGNVYSSGSFIPSGLNLKHNVNKLDKAMDVIGRLDPKIYQYNSEKNFKSMNLPEGQHYGLIAEDVENVLPTLVKQSKFEPATDESVAAGTAPAAIDFKALNYTELIPIMIKGMQEQQAVIEKQQQQIAELKQMFGK
jgi:Chaperone of endosialidase